LAGKPEADAAIAIVLGIPLYREAEEQAEIDRMRDTLGPSE